MPKPNTKFEADVVITPELTGAYAVWVNDKRIATGTAHAARLVAAGASASKLSVYDAEADHFLSGTLAQLAPNGEA